jgi:hypothetical protein
MSHHFERAALDAVEAGDASGFVRALARQFEGLLRLGRLAGVPICTDAVRSLYRLARDQHAVVLPAGAGGGDVCLYVGGEPPSAALLAKLSEVDQQRLSATLGAEGARPEPSP